ncbi:MAG: hypothetical protein HY906_09350 [Deltaproteobacteria bacterium]|nr:hypothetical protein [Deltaproteobacteria bacterium]
MARHWQILCNVVLYGFLLWLLYDSTLKEWDPWFAFVVAFVLVLAVVVSLIPGLHAPRVSPGSYPFDS